MSPKELFVASTPHETKVAIVEDDQLNEIYFERENEYTLAGSIYKGRVTRVLPGMQSAFVDLGLERDAFLYVTDFLEEQEDQEEFERVATTAHDEATGGRGEQPREPRAEAAPAPPQRELDEQVSEVEPEAQASEPVSEGGQAEDRNGGGARRWRGRRRRGGRGRGRDRGDRGERPERSEARPVEPRNESTVPEAGGEQNFSRGDRGERRDRPRGFEPRREARPAYEPIVLPGESISKYRNLQPLPGESLAKHQEAPAAVENHTRQFEPEVRTEDLGERRAEEPFVAASEDYHDTPAAAPAPEREELPNREAREHKAEDIERFEHMNVASVFGAEEAAHYGDPHAETAKLPEDTVREVVEEVTPAASFAPGAGTVEEEEIEDEESELPSLDDDDDVTDFEELEEETLESDDPNMVPAAELGDAVRDVHVQERATGHFEEEGLEENGNGDAEEDEGEEFDESEETEGSEVMAESGEGEPGMEASEQTESPDRAEVRGANGTAGYQQRAPREGREGFDRRRGQRGRRGRRFRGRRNIPARGQAPINELLKEGQEILVQIAKEPIGKKGARITSHIALPGRFLVYMPTVNHIGVSRKIGSEEERQRLKRILLSEREESKAHGGFIVRTAAAGASEDDLRADIRFLINLWTEIKNRAESSKAPALIYHDLNLVERILRDQVTQNFSQIWVDTESEYERILRFASRFQPALVKRIKLYTKETPLFEQFGIQEEINKALKSKVWLKSGGYIVINQTEALVAIDVNTGKYVGKTSRLEDTIVKTNVDAIKEIVRQIRLRDLGGIIVIDFIDMDERRNRQKVMQALEEALRNDRAPSKVLQFNDFGLVAITRKRVKQSLERTLGSPCPYCTGTGLVKAVNTVANEIWVEMKKIAKHLERGDVILRVNPEVGKALKANNARWLTDLEELTGRTVIVKADPVLHQEQFDIH
jgi:Rne/Rng family ribonuclease